MSQENESSTPNWRTQFYLVGAIIGAFMGFLSAYLFTKEAEDGSEDASERPQIAPSAVLGLALSVLTLIRQIAETGRKKPTEKVLPKSTKPTSGKK